MKKILLMTAICAAAMVGCTNNDETPEQQEVNFSPLSYKSTRAIIGGSIYSITDPNFGVYAFYSAQGKSWSANLGEASLYINDKEIKYVAGKKAWASDTPTYWPLDGSLTFIAYSPKTLNATCVDKTLTFTDFVVKDTAQEDQVDLLYTIPSDATGKTQNETNYGGVTGGAAGVGIKFRHALTQILVNVKVAADYGTEAVYKVNSITLLGMNDKGTLVVAPDATATSVAPGATINGVNWTLATSTSPQVIYPTGISGTLTTGGALIGDPILVLPQDLSSTQQLQIKYQMTNGQGVTSSTTRDITLFKDGDFEELAMNKKITLNITISADEILYAPSVTDWDLASEDYVDNTDF